MKKMQVKWRPGFCGALEGQSLVSTWNGEAAAQNWLMKTLTTARSPEHDSSCLEGQGDLVSRSRIRITGVLIWFVGAISILTKSP